MGNGTVRRTYKDSLFRMVFREKGELLTLYNAINGTSYENPDDLEITTIDDVLYLGLKNDISFLIKEYMNLYEGQSTWNPNMPLRGVFYISQLYQAYVRKNHLNIYSAKQIKLPAPRYVVFYNGTREEPDRQILRLTDAFIKREETPCLECIALVLNINFGKNRELMEACRKLYEYSYFVSEVQGLLQEGMSLETAIDRTVRRCIRENILKEFLEKHRAEVKNVILTEFDEELYRQLVYKEGREDGEAAGLTEGRRRDVLELLEELGPVPEELREKIMSQENQDVLSRWLKAAARAESLQGFAEKMDGSK